MKDSTEQKLKDFILKTIKSRSSDDLLDFNKRMGLTLKEMLDGGLTSTQLNSLPIDFISDSVKNNLISIDDLSDAELNDTTLELVRPVISSDPTPITHNHHNESSETIENKSPREELLNEIASGEALIEAIQRGLLAGIINRSDMYALGCDNDIIDRLVSYEDIPVIFPKKHELPKLRKGTDIYLLGYRGSGKSTMLASFFSYTKREGFIESVDDNTFGNRYKNQLQLGMVEGHLPSSTPTQFVNYVPVNLRLREKKYHQPLNFLDMAGERLKGVYEGGITAFDEYKDFLENENAKILIFVVDYFKENNKRKIVEQEQRLDELFVELKKNKIDRKVVAIYIILTKADLFPEQNKFKYCDNYINKNYNNFLEVLKRSSRENKFQLRSFPFSIGPSRFSYVLQDCDPSTNTNLVTYPKLLLEQFERDCPTISGRAIF